MRHLRSFTVTLILLLAIPLHAFAGTVESGGGGFGGGGGAGDASLAEQQTQTGILTTIDSDTGTIAGAVKAEDVAHASGDTGVMSLCVRQDTAAALAGTNGDYIPCTTDATGRMWTNTELPDAAALADGTSNPTTTGVAAYNMCFNGTTWDRCTGTSTLHYATSAASNNATNVKNAAGTVSTISVVNTTATIYYLRMYNLASAPTCSSATGFVNTIPVPASTSGAGIVIPITVPHSFTTGIGYCLTGGGSSTDNTNAATGVYINIWYK